MPGLHGFHVHQNPDRATGMKNKPMREWRPVVITTRRGPANMRGLMVRGISEICLLYVGSDGKAILPRARSALKTADLKGRSLMIHAGGTTIPMRRQRWEGRCKGSRVDKVAHIPKTAFITRKRRSLNEGNEKIIEHLNARLAEELTAINQYMVHAEMCDNWNYEKLHKAIQKRAIDEMKHAEKLITRILFLEGRPIVSDLNKLYIGAEVPKMHENDRGAEEGAIKGYNESVRVAVEVGDNGTRELFESILKEEEDHIDWIEAQLDQIKQLGPQNYLVEQIE
jgi:bacterioferritin